MKRCTRCVCASRVGVRVGHAVRDGADSVPGFFRYTGCFATVGSFRRVGVVEGLIEARFLPLNGVEVRVGGRRRRRTASACGERRTKAENSKDEGGEPAAHGATVSSEIGGASEKVVNGLVWMVRLDFSIEKREAASRFESPLPDAGANVVGCESGGKKASCFMCLSGGVVRGRLNGTTPPAPVPFSLCRHRASLGPRPH